MRQTFVLVALVAVVVTGTLIAADQPKVTAKICTAVKDRAPVGEGLVHRGRHASGKAGTLAVLSENETGYSTHGCVSVTGARFVSSR